MYSPPPPLQIEIEYSLVCLFRREAARRGMPVRSLIHKLLDTIARDELTTAVLDDDKVET